MTLLTLIQNLESYHLVYSIKNFIGSFLPIIIFINLLVIVFFTYR